MVRLISALIGMVVFSMTLHAYAYDRASGSIKIESENITQVKINFRCRASGISKWYHYPWEWIGTIPPDGKTIIIDNAIPIPKPKSVGVTCQIREICTTDNQINFRKVIAVDTVNNYNYQIKRLFTDGNDGLYFQDKDNTYELKMGDCGF